MIHRGTPTREDYLQAQSVIDQHVTLSRTGRCKTCDAYGPCNAREGAIRVMSRYLWLPTRIPGASRPELVGAHHVH
jgi:hypothetical protein